MKILVYLKKKNFFLTNVSQASDDTFKPLTHTHTQHTSSVMMPTTTGERNPVTAAMELEMPKRMPAKAGAMSTWLTRKPLYWKPAMETPSTSRAIATAGCVQSTYPSPTSSNPATTFPAQVILHGVKDHTAILLLLSFYNAVMLLTLL